MIKFAVENPVKVLVGICFLVIFGVQAFLNMPYRLIPSIEYPQISVSTYWRGASPYEVEKEIIDRQERVLKTIPGLIDCESSAKESSAYITLMFDIDVSVSDAMLLVSNKLNEVSGYPDNMNQPTIRAANTDAVSVVDLMLLTDDTNRRSIDEYLSFFEETIKPYFDRINGVADVSYWGGRARQMQIEVDPYRLSAYNITLSSIITALNQENVNISAGNIDFGAKDYRFRTTAEAKEAIIQNGFDLSKTRLKSIASGCMGTAVGTGMFKVASKTLTWIPLLGNCLNAAVAGVTTAMIAESLIEIAEQMDTARRRGEKIDEIIKKLEEGKSP